jgi:hypothetical protein
MQDVMAITKTRNTSRVVKDMGKATIMLRMSAFGPKQTSAGALQMSA